MYGSTCMLNWKGRVLWQQLCLLRGIKMGRALFGTCRFKGTQSLIFLCILAQTLTWHFEEGLSSNAYISNWTKLFSTILLQLLIFWRPYVCSVICWLGLHSRMPTVQVINNCIHSYICKYRLSQKRPHSLLIINKWFNRISMFLNIFKVETWAFLIPLAILSHGLKQDLQNITFSNKHLFLSIHISRDTI